MASKKHQFILGLIIKKMKEDGFIVKCVDGKYNEAFSTYVQVPPKLLKHRPDAFGVNQDGIVAIGEAKTENDIQSLRTSEQLSDYSNIELNGNNCRIYVGIPKSANKLLTNLIIKLGLINNTNLIILNIPDDIINE